MRTPIADFVRTYAASHTSRLHMPGHKGAGPLGFEKFDITEIAGADALYEADGIIAESEQHASQLFGTRRTLYSTEGSSQCIRAMLYLAITQRPKSSTRTILAARNVHKAFVYAAALVDFDVEWLWPVENSSSLCACPVSPALLETALGNMEAPPAAVYVTSPDYLGGMQDISALAEICHKHGTILIVDNAHGAYLHFCSPAMHPMDLGADICCDSAHKTLPVLTGGAYLHISKNLPAVYADNAKQAMVLFGSTSPSYLTLCSLDMCNAYIADGYREKLRATVENINVLCAKLIHNGWQVSHDEPLKLTIHASACGMTGSALADRLRENGVECEFADTDDLVLMITPENTPEDLEKVFWAAGNPDNEPAARMPLPVSKAVRAMSIREAFFAPHETVPASSCEGRICAAPTVACPPAIPIAVSGEVISAEMAELFRKYGVENVEVIKQS